MYDPIVRLIAILWLWAGLGCTPAERAYNRSDFLSGQSTYDLLFPAEARARATAEAQERRAGIANQLMKSARSYALAGDCIAVHNIAAREQRFDPSFYSDVFVRDVAIAHCLGTSRTPT